MIITSQRSMNIGLGELTATRDTSLVLTCNGLGSCIAMCVYDPVTGAGGMAHMLLPICRSKNDNFCSPAKYIDTGVPLLINRNLIVKIAGGAKMLAIPGNSQLDIGQKNINQIKDTLIRENMRICGADLGGGFGRTVSFFLDTGKVAVKVVSGREIEL